MNTYQRLCFVSVAAVILLVSATAQAASYRLLSSPQAVIGSQELESGEIDQAIEELERSLTERGGDPVHLILTNLCVARIAKGDFDKAVSTCEQAVAENCSGNAIHSFNANFLDAISHNNRGVLRARLGDYQGAMEDFELASRPIVDHEDIRHKLSPYGHEIRTNMRLAIREQVSDEKHGQFTVADVD